jgi:dihydropteroate synthase
MLYIREMILPRNRYLDFSRPIVMGVINVTPDSFSDANECLRLEDAVKRSHEIISEGGDIIDVGGESSRPGSDPVSPEEERERVIPVIEAIRGFSDIPISIDTTKAGIAELAVEAGADIINDISALRHDAGMVSVVAKYNTPVVLMHMLGTPKTMQENPYYDDCIGEIKEFFAERIEFCTSNEIGVERIILDPGIGFGKRLEDNLTIVRRLSELKIFGCPLMIGASRKSFISMITGIKGQADKRIGGSLVAMFYAIRSGCNVVRVHDVAEAVEAIKVLSALENFS